MFNELKFSIPAPAEVTLEMHNDLDEKHTDLQNRLQEKIDDLQAMVDKQNEESEKQLSNHEGRLKALEYQVDLLR